MTQSIFFAIHMKLPDENQLMDLLKRPKYDGRGNQLHRGTVSQYAPFRKKCLTDVSLLMRSYFIRHKLDFPRIKLGQRCRFRFDWYEPDKRRDPDNVASAGRKIILDAMRATGMLPNDGVATYVEEEWSIMDSFHYAHGDTGVHVIVDIFEAGERAEKPQVAP